MNFAYPNRSSLVNREAMAKRSIDIEKLLQWTYCEELVKGGTEAYRPAWDMIGRNLGELGTMVDESHFGKLPPIFGEPHPDALTVGRYVNRMPGRAASLVMVAAWKKCRPEPFQGLPTMRPERDGSRVRIFNGRSYGQMWASGRQGKSVRLYTEGSECRIIYNPTLEYIAQTRRDWTLWRTALVWLVAVLADKLSENLPTGPTAPERLWE